MKESIRFLSRSSFEMTILYFFFTLFFSLNIFSQDKEPKPINFKWHGSSTPRPLTLDSFPQKQFALGFQWGGPVEFQKDMNMTVGDGNAALGILIQAHYFIY